MISLKTLAIAVASTIVLVPNCPAQAVTLKALHTFSGGSDGGTPLAGVIDVSGILYGTTSAGGGTGCSGAGCGTLFAYNLSTNKESVLHAFAGGNDGAGPAGSVIDVNGVLYGTTVVGGSPSGSGCGTVFSYNLSTKKEKVLYSFQCSTDGEYPEAGLVHASGYLYGTTVGNTGNIFKVDISTGALTVLYTFQPSTDGENPYSQLIDVNGKLYGTTFEAGKYSGGTLFSYNLSTKKETTLYSFQGGNDGSVPQAGVVYKSGILYGTTSSGGPGGWGTVFAFDLSTRKETVLYGFTGGADGGQPLGLIDVSGSLYGTTYAGYGTLYKVDISTKTETVLHSFDGSDGANPAAPVISVSGILYGTTSAGGSGFGNVFKAH